jgi:endonuclease V-like protein UPF0215 family
MESGLARKMYTKLWHQKQNAKNVMRSFEGAGKWPETKRAAKLVDGYGKKIKKLLHGENK